jgi:integrase
MARTARSAQLDSRAARLRLKPRRKPYRVGSAKQGLLLGYRRMANKNGSWIAFAYQGTSGNYAERAFAQADDYSDADGEEVLTYFDAMRRVSGEAPPVRHGSAYTIRDLIDGYVGYLEQHRKSAADARSNLNAYLIPHFGEDRQVAGLTSADFEKWQPWALTHKPRGRLKAGKQSKQAMRDTAKARGKEMPPSAPAASKEELLRRRKSRLNRIINDVHAALAYAADTGKVSTRDAWSRLQKYRGVDQARIQWLTVEQARRLTNACEPDFRRLIEVALLTGARYGELRRMLVRDFDARSKTALVAESKASKPRRLPLTEEGCRLLEELTAGKDPNDFALIKADGTQWQKSEQHRRIHEACAAASIMPTVTFHGIRHTFASLLVTAGVPLAFVAEALGHSDTRMVSKHYAHLAPNVVHDAIRANLPSFGVQTEGKVQKLRP